MSKKKHTPEPWSTCESHKGQRVIQRNDNGDSVAFVNNDADAARIVACVNALASIEDPAAFVEAYTRLASVAHGFRYGSHTMDDLHAALDAVYRVKGG